MSTSDEASQPQRPSKPYTPPKNKTHDRQSRIQPPASALGRKAGRQAYTVHASRHDRQHHRPGK